MKMTQKALLFIMIFSSHSVFHNASAQGWVAVIDIDLNHELYAFEKITNASVTYSGVTITESSETSSLQLTIRGSGPLTGELALTVNGIAFEPYYSNEPYSEPISGVFSGDFTEVCTRRFFEKDGESASEQVSIWIEVYPRLEIAHVVNSCDAVSFFTSTCSNIFLWEVSDAIDGVYRTLAGKNTASMTVLRNDLISLGFSDPYGRKYFRVTGRPGTASQIQPVDIYYPAPDASIRVTPPTCHDGTDGTLLVNITSFNESVVNDFVVTLFPVTSGGQMRQVAVNDGFTASFGSLVPGTYRLRIENNSRKEIYGACWVDMDVEPLINPAPVLIGSLEPSDYTGYAISCNGSSDGRLRVHPQGGTGTYTEYEWRPEVSTNHLAENLLEGVYEVRVKDSNGCWSASRSQRLSSPEKLTVSLLSIGGKNGFDVSCADKADGAIETVASGGVDGYTFSWSNGAAGKDLFGASPGFYEITVTDANACTATASATLYAPPPIDFNIAEISGIACAGQSSGMLEIQAVTGAIGAEYYSWSTEASGKAIANLPAGVYVASVSDDQGCATAKSRTLTEPPAWAVDVAILSGYNGAPVRCNGDASGQLNAIVTDGQQEAVYAQQYLWYRNDELIPAENSSTLSNVPAGNYKVEITYRDFCRAEATAILQEPAPLTVTVSNESDYNGFTVSCYGQADGAIRAVAKGGTGNLYTYVWEDGQEGPLLDGLGAGSYIVTARDINGCQATAEKKLEQPEPVRAVISVVSNYNGQAITCQGAADGRVRASATGGRPPYTYLWNSRFTTQELLDVSAGHYFLTATDANGCASEADHVIPDPDPVEVSITASSDHHGYGVSCYGASDGYLSSAASGGTGYYTFSWEGGHHDGPLYENLPAGRFTVSVTDQNGCSSAATASLTEPQPIALVTLAMANVSCSGGTDGEIKLNATGGAGGFLFSASGESWQDDPLLTGLKAGTYHPIAVDVNGCRQMITETITAPLSITIHFEDIQPALCGEPRGTVSAVVSGGIEPYLYEWTNSDQQVISTAPRLSDLAAGIIRLKVRDQHHCEATKAVGITSANGPSATVSNIVPVSCHDTTDGQAQVVAQGDYPFTFHWPDGQTTSEAINLKKGEHLVAVRDAKNCLAVASVVIASPDSIQVELVEETAPLCAGDCNGKLSVSGKGGNGDYNFVWKDFTGPDATNLCAGQHTVMILDGKGCRSAKTFQLTAPEPLGIEPVSKHGPVCIDKCDGRIEVKATGGTGNLSYRWSTGGTGPDIMNVCAGTFNVAVTDEHQCTVSETFTLDDPIGTVIDLGNSVTLCAGQTHSLDAGPLWEKYSWGSTTGLTGSGQRIKISEAGMYWIEATSRKGCIARDTFSLRASSDLLDANFLLASEAMTTDTVVTIDISWPLPDGIVWTLPPEFKQLYDAGDIVYGKFEHPGRFNISLNATLGECRDEVTKSITVLATGKEHSPQGSVGRERFVIEFSLYPNPNDGSFDVVVGFRDISPLTLTVWNALTGKKISHVNDAGHRAYQKHIDLRPLSAGSYTLKLDYKHGTRYLRFIAK